MKRFFLFLILLSGCKECPEKTPPFTRWDVISSREEDLEKEIVYRPLYRAKVLESWQKKESDDLSDTRLPNVTYIVDKDLKITVHSFPSNSIEERISPLAQIERWKTQLEESKCLVEPLSRAGFYGFFLEGEKEGNKVLAWAMQLDLDHYQSLQFLSQAKEEKEHARQMCSDFTIKIAGPADLVEKHRDPLLLFAESFELIQAIPESS